MQRQMQGGGWGMVAANPSSPPPLAGQKKGERKKKGGKGKGEGEKECAPKYLLKWCQDRTLELFNKDY